MNRDRDRYQPSPLADVQVETGDGEWTLVFVRDFKHPPEKIWAALTEPAQLQEWSPFTADRNLGATGDATLIHIDGDVEEPASSTVRVVEPPHRLVYTMGEAVLRWELEATPTGTQLTLRHTVDAEDWLTKAAAGWHLCLDVLEHLLDGDPVGPIRGEDAKNYGWQELNDQYAKVLDVD